MMFSVLVLGIVMLFIPATSIANAQEYDDKHYEDESYKKVYKKSYNESYKKDERKSYYTDDDEKYKNDDKIEEPIIIIKNEPIQKKEKKDKKEPPMLLVKKDVLYCDFFSGVSDQRCIDPIPDKNSERWLQTCTLDNEICDNLDEAFFKIMVTDDIKFPGSKDGIKLNFNGERYTVTEDPNLGNIIQHLELCREANFDDGFLVNENILICTEFEGECSGIVEDNELKECTVNNFVVGASTTKLTVNKEIYGCDDIEVNDEIESDITVRMNCGLLDDDPEWTLCDDLVANNVEFADLFCNPLQENEFDIEVSDSNNVLINPPGQFEGSTEGTMIMDLEPGTYNVQEIKHDTDDNQLGLNVNTENNCRDALLFDDGGVFANNEDDVEINYTICFEYEDENGEDCSSIDLQEGDNKTCTVKNYISSTGSISLPE